MREDDDLKFIHVGEFNSRTFVMKLDRTTSPTQISLPHLHIRAVEGLLPLSVPIVSYSALHFRDEIGL